MAVDIARHDLEDRSRLLATLALLSESYPGFAAVHAAVAARSGPRVELAELSALLDRHPT